MNPITGLYKLLYMPICRSYAWHLGGDKPPDPVLYCLWGLHFWKVHGYWPQYKIPRSFSEKVWNRMLYDRDPRWTMFSDKLRVRDYVARIVDGKYLVPLLWNGSEPEDIPFEDLPMKFVIKTNHGADFNIIVRDKMQLDQTHTKLTLKKWLGENYCKDHQVGMEWGYKNIKATIIVETFLDDNGSLPVDYKFMCYSGQAQFVQVDRDRYTKDHTRTFLDRDFNRLPFEYGKKLYPGELLRPDNYREMLQLAESLAAEFDLIRVDLYNVGGRLYVGELTCYPGGGVIKFTPRKYDFLLGEKWDMEYKPKSISGIDPLILFPVVAQRLSDASGVYKESPIQTFLDALPMTREKMIGYEKTA